MKENIPNTSRIWQCFLPISIGLGTALILLVIPGGNPVFRYQGRIDLSMLILCAGLILTLIFLIYWISKKRNERNREQSLAIVKDEAEQSRHRFLERLDHELKNPLTALHAQLGYLSKKEGRRENDQVLDDMSSQLVRLKHLVNGLRQLAELEEKQIDFNLVDVENLLHEVIETAQTNPLYSDRQIKLTLLQTPWKFTSIQGDRSLLSLAVYNLLDNALKFTSTGAEIEIRSFEMDSWLVIEVADNGLGIPEEELPFIFEELYRGANARGQPGSGLGLALVKTIIMRHKGSVSVRSQLGKGTIFSLHLPLA